MENYSTYYADIAKPFFAPEPWVFGAAWGIIYPLIVIAGCYTAYLFYKKKAAGEILHPSDVWSEYRG